MALLFEFAVEGPPVSQQARRRDRVREWTRTVRDAARQNWGEGPISNSLVMVSITYIFDTVDFDVDNIPKPILDALKGLVYEDDSQVTDLICRKRRISDDSMADLSSPGFDDFLLPSTPFLLVRVSDSPVSEVLT